ncbi:primosomal protein N', partial [Staphylococcus nepalensis]
ARYTKVFEIVEDESIPDDILKRFNKEGHYAYKAAQQNGDLKHLVPLLEEGIVREETLLSQNTKKKTQRAIRIRDDHQPDEVLAMLERHPKQYDVYAYLLDAQNRDVPLKELEEVGLSASSAKTLERNGFVEKYDAIVERDPYASRVFEQEEKRQLTPSQ